MKSLLIFSALIISFFVFGCSSPPDVEVTQAEFAEHIYFPGKGLPKMTPGLKAQISVGEKGVWCKYEEHHIVKLLLDFNFKSLDTKEEIGSDEYKNEVFLILAKNAHLYDGSNEIERFFGYWPEDATETSVSQMTMFYVIPVDTDLKNLRFEYDRSILGINTGTYTYVKFDEMEPLETEG